MFASPAHHQIIPVMLMGKFLKGTIYGPRDYFEAVLITLGVFVFSYNSKSDKGGQVRF